jgi:hypothetical protein
MLMAACIKYLFKTNFKWNKMEFLNHEATNVFTKLVDALKDDQYLKIENSPFMSLSIEKIGIGISTSWGRATLYSFCHFMNRTAT